MAFYLFMFFSNMLIGLIIYNMKIVKLKERTKIYLVFTFVQLTTIAGCRSAEVGWDTNNYLKYFQMVESNGSLFSSLRMYTWVEPGYIVFCYMVYLLGGNAQISLVIAGALVYLLILYFIYKYASSPILSVMSLFCFPVFYDSLSMLRNAIVCSLFLLSFILLEEKKYGKTIVCTLIAMSFHNFAFIFIPLYFIGKIKWKTPLKLVMAFLALLIVYNNLIGIIRGIVNILGVDKYAWYVSGDSYWFGQHSGGVRTAIFYTLIVFMAYFIYVKKRDRNIIQDKLSGYTLLLPAAAIIYTIAPMFIRVMLMMMPIAGVFISNEIVGLKNSGNKKIIGFGYCVLLFAFQIFTLWSNAEHYVPYIPFWRI